MADTFGLQFDGLRDKLAQAGGYEDIVLYGSTVGTTPGDLYITGLSSEKPGIPVPEDSSIFVEISFTTKFSNDAVEAGCLRFHAARTGSGNVVLGDIIGGSGTVEYLSQFSSDAAALALVLGLVPTVDTTNQGIRIVATQTGGSETAYCAAKAKIVCVNKGQLLPPYSGGATANSPFGVS